MKGIKKNQVSKISNGNILVKSWQHLSQNLGSVPKLYLAINYDGFPSITPLQIVQLLILAIDFLQIYFVDLQS